MQIVRFIIRFIIVATIISSCHKNHSRADDCFPDAATVRQIKDKQAIIKSAGGQFYIVEQGAIDSKLIPCNLAKEFQVDNSVVTLSGDVKATLNTAFEPCCTENLVITKITK